MESWVFLLVGGLGAVGAALSLGTLAALVQYRRTGDLPGATDDATDATQPTQPTQPTETTQPTQTTHATRPMQPTQPTETTRATEPEEPAQPTPPAQPAPGTERRLWARIAIGAVVAVVCFTILAQQGLLGGALLG